MPLLTPGRIRAWLIWFVVCNLSWLWLISGFYLNETILGLFASAVAATAATAVAEQNPLRFRLRLGWLLLAARLPAKTVRETAVVLGALVDRLRGRPVTGAFRTVHVSLPEDPSESAAKRAFLIAGESFAPNGYVLGIDEETGAMLLHELIPDGPAEMTP